MNPHLPESEYAARRERLVERMQEHGIDALFVPPSSDLEYLTGLERDLPSFGQSSYAHGWVTGAFIVPGREPLYVLPRMFVAFHLWGEEPASLITVNEPDDGRAIFRKATGSLGAITSLGIGARTWGETVLELQGALPSARIVNGTPIVNELRRVKSDLELDLMKKAALIADGAMTATSDKVEPGVTMADLAEEVEHQLRVRGSRTPSFPTHIFSYGYTQSHDSTMAIGLEPIADGEAVMFDFGAVWAGYCSDFGRTIVAGEPHPEYERVYDVMLAAQEAGRAAAVPGALASEVNAACRAPIEEAGLGAVLPPPDGPRHRSRRPRAAVHLGGGRDAARGGNDVHRRAVDPVGRPLRGPDRGRCRVRRGRRAHAERAVRCGGDPADSRKGGVALRGSADGGLRVGDTWARPRPAEERRGGSGLPVRFVASSCHDELTRETRARFGLVHERADLGVAHCGGLVLAVGERRGGHAPPRLPHVGGELTELVLPSEQRERKRCVGQGMRHLVDHGEVLVEQPTGFRRLTRAQEHARVRGKRRQHLLVIRDRTCELEPPQRFGQRVGQLAALREDPPEHIVRRKGGSSRSAARPTR